MGIGTLRRYHDDSRVVGETPLPEGAVGATQEAAAAVAGASEELENDRKLNELAEQIQAAEAQAWRGRDSEAAERLAERVAELEAEYAEALAAQPDAETREPLTPEDQPDTAQTTEVRGDPEGNETRGDIEPTVTVKDADDTRSQGDATPQDGEDAPQASETPDAGSANPEGENGAEAATEGAAEASTDHAGIPRPASTGSTDAWITYAKADPKGEPFDLAKRPGLRDDLVAHYTAG